MMSKLYELYAGESRTEFDGISERRFGRRPHRSEEKVYQILEVRFSDRPNGTQRKCSL